MRARGAVVVALSTIAALSAVALILVPPVLAQVPGPPLEWKSTVVVGLAGGDATVAGVTVSAGWTKIGMGPFLSGDRVTLVSPDGVYRAEFELVAGQHRTASNGDEVPGDTTKHLVRRLRAAAWSTESLRSGNQVRYATVLDGGTAVTVAVVDPSPDALPASHIASDAPDRLVLVASAPTTAAARYRTVTADLVSSVAFHDRRPRPAPSEDPRG
jgi:hypothetical protein